jgi:AhpD family alkylhydroperoxidase
MTRMKLFETHPEGYKAVVRLESYCSRSIPRELYEIVKLRASILNGCSFCTDMHSRDGIEVGIPTAKLFGVAAWHESPHFDDRERAALRLTDTVTKLGPDGVPDDIWDEAAAQFDETLLGDLLFAIATINVWNRLAIPTQLEPQA